MAQKIITVFIYIIENYMTFLILEKKKIKKYKEINKKYKNLILNVKISFSVNTSHFKYTLSHTLYDITFPTKVYF